jgi:hypothetical protein
LKDPQQQMAMASGCRSPMLNLIKVQRKDMVDPSTPTHQCFLHGNPQIEPTESRLTKVSSLTGVIRQLVAAKQKETAEKHTELATQMHTVTANIHSIPSDVLRIVATLAGGSSIAQMERSV